MYVEEGDKAPDFTLPNEDNRPVTLSKELGEGPVVLSFYLFDFTGVCTKQACSFRDAAETFQKYGAKVFGISADSPFSHHEFERVNQLNFPLLSDWGHVVSRAYGVHHEEIFGLPGAAMRSVFVLDKDGVVRYKWVTEDPSIPPDTAEVAGAVKALAK
ncbi:MAG: redoxin domain-containing protein [Thermoplasmata archaeon]